MPASALVRGGFWPENGVSTLTLSGEDSYGRHRIAAQFGTKGMAALREITETLVGAAPGGVASASRTRVAHSEELGGKRAVETEALVARATTAADVTEVKDSLLTYSTRTYDPTPVPNLDRNPLGDR
jgi:hypothetical protein